jgi:hypothetical protein
MTDSFQEYLDNRTKREKVQEAYIDRIIDGMTMGDLVHMAQTYFHEEMCELSDEQLYEDVQQYYPDLLETE